MNSELIKAPLRVTFFGDSICVGQGVSIYKGWVPHIARDLNDIEEEIGHEIIVTNASVNGRTTRQALEDMPYMVQSHEPDIMIVQFGLNDCNYWATDRGAPRVSLKAFSANLIEIIERGKLSDTRFILLSTNHPTLRNKEILPYTSITYEDSNRAYNEAVRDVARDLGDEIIFCDIERAFWAHVDNTRELEKFLLADALHLSTAGHELYYELIGPIIFRIVREAVEVMNAREIRAAT